MATSARKGAEWATTTKGHTRRGALQPAGGPRASRELLVDCEAQPDPTIERHALCLGSDVDHVGRRGRGGSPCPPEVEDQTPDTGQARGTVCSSLRSGWGRAGERSAFILFPRAPGGGGPPSSLPHGEGGDRRGALAKAFRRGASERAGIRARAHPAGRPWPASVGRFTEDSARNLHPAARPTTRSVSAPCGSGSGRLADGAGHSPVSAPGWRSPVATMGKVRGETSPCLWTGAFRIPICPEGRKGGAKPASHLESPATAGFPPALPSFNSDPRSPCGWSVT